MNRIITSMLLTLRISSIQAPKTVAQDRFVSIIKLQTFHTGVSWKNKNKTDTNPGIEVAALEALVEKNGLDLQKLEVLYKRARYMNRAYLMFIKANYSTASEGYPKLTKKYNIEIMRKQGLAWASLDAEGKLKWYELAKDENERLRVELETFLENVSFEERIEMKKLIDKLLLNKSLAKQVLALKNKEKKEILKSGKPKKPMNSWSLFKRDQDRGDAGIFDFSTGCSYKWQALTVQDKQKYVDLSKENKDRYRAEMMEWESRMLLEGRPEFVRVKTLDKIERIGKTVKKMKANKKKLGVIDEDEDSVDDREGKTTAK